MLKLVRVNRMSRNYPFTTTVLGIYVLYLFVICSQQLLHHVSISIKWMDIEIDNLSVHPSTSSIQEFVLNRHILQYDPRLTQIIHSGGFLTPPVNKNVPYNLTNPMEDPSLGQSDIIKKIFKNKTNGFFIESGALDGETRSNTLSLELELGWKGLLIEPDPLNFASLLEKKRKAWLSPSCLSVHPYPHRAMLFLNYSTSKVIADHDDIELIREPNSGLGMNEFLEDNYSNLTTVQCFPLFSLLAALNVSTVDYLSLDIEGSEIDVLKTIPFHLITIQVISVEITHGIYKRGTANYLKHFMGSKGYNFVTRVMHPESYANDVVFARKTFHYNARFAPEILHWNSTLTFDLF